MGWMTEVNFPAGSMWAFSFYHCIHTGSGAHSTAYPIGIRDTFPEGKAAGAL